MWKYVGQRLKDSTELTCTHLKNLRSTFSTCNANAIKDISKKKGFRRFEVCQHGHGRVHNVWKAFDSNEKQKKEVSKISNDLDTPYIIQKCYQKQKQKQDEPFHRCIDINFLQWVSQITLLSLYITQHSGNNIK